jgi:hypothetical protein
MELMPAFPKMNGHSLPATYSDTWESFKQTDAEKDAFVASLIRENEELKAKCKDSSDEYENEKASRRHWQSKASLFEREVNEQKRMSVSLSLLDFSDAIS